MRIRKCISIISVLIGIITLSSCITSSSTMIVEYEKLNKQIRVAIIDFKNTTKYGARRLSDSAVQILVSELSRSGNFIIIEREKLDAVLKELEFQLSDLSQEGNAAEVGKILNCEYLISGGISNFGVKTEGRDLLIAKQKIQTVKVEVDLKLIDVETAQIVYSAFGKGETEKVIGSALGIGGSGGYDETLAGECLRAAISQAVEKKIKFFKIH